MPNPSSAKPNTREAILDAAEAVVTEDGAGRLTIDAVVTRSGFSKGGVLYHFPSKTALLEGMVQRLMADISTDIDAAKAAAQDAGEPPMPKLIEVLGQKKRMDTGVPAALLAASAEQPELLDPARALTKELWDLAHLDSPDPVQASIIMLVLDGMHFNDLLGFNQLTEIERTAVNDRLLQMTREMFK